MNTILWESKKMKYHTDLKIALEALEGRQKEFNWLITDFECSYYPKLLEHKERVWISGEELTNLALENEVLQFIWGVLSAFSKIS